MRVAVVAGPDAGHAIPAIELSRRLVAAGDVVTLYTGERWLAPGAVPVEGLRVAPLRGLRPRRHDDDSDAGAKIYARAAHIAECMLDELRSEAPDLVVSDILTAGGGMAAELLGIPWIELSPHPLYLPSRGLPPIGSGLAPGIGLRGLARDHVLRALTARSLRQGREHRAAARLSIGLAPDDPGPDARLVATLPALEVPRPDTPAHTHVVGPLVWEPTDDVLSPPPGRGPIVTVAPSTAATGAPGMLEAVFAALAPDALGRDVRALVTMLDPGGLDVPANAVVGRGRQDRALAASEVVVCGGGHGLLAKALSAGVPAVVVPGGGDQYELAMRAHRQGSALVVRPVDAGAVSAAVRRVLDEPAFGAAARAAARSAARVEDPVAACREVVGRVAGRRRSP